MRQTNILFSFIFLLSSLTVSGAWAQESPAPEPCKVDDRACILSLLETEAAAIDNKAWRDQTYRELAKTLAFEGQIDQAIALIAKIDNPDTKAMTIRGIGMEAADLRLNPAETTNLFAKLRTEAEKITHLPSYAIALTYIAMGQAFAGDNQGAWETAAAMSNDALRHKAYGETAEIQAERGDAQAAMQSIAKIDSLAYRNKAYNTVAKLLADRQLYEEALAAAMKIDNAYKKTEAIQHILDSQKPRDTSER